MKTNIFFIILFVIILIFLFISNNPFQKDSSFLKNNHYRWGNYKPHTIFSITEQDKNPLTVRMAYFNEYNSEFRYDLTPNTENLILNYPYHNGKDFSIQEINEIELKVLIRTTLLKENIHSNKQSWSALIEGINGIDILREFKMNYIFSFGLEQFQNPDDPKPYFIFKNPQISNRYEIRNIFTQQLISSFEIKYYEETQQTIKKELDFTFVNKTNQTINWNVSEDMRNFLFNKKTSNFYKKNRLTSNLLLIKVPMTFYQNSSIYITYNEYPNIEKSFSEFQLLVKKKKINFDLKLNEILPSSQYNKKCVASALSNLFGGMIYMYGPIYISNTKKNSNFLEMFTGTPSRTRFKISYLWDDGFHNMLFVKWDPELSLEIIKSWMKTVFPSGYLAREQSRGKETDSFDFLPQDIQDSNPPTLLFPLLYVFENLNNNNYFMNSLKEIYPNLKLWFFYFVDSQKPTKEFLYQWSVLKDDYFLGSGIDDYPRNDLNFESKFHLDLQIWVIFFSETLIKFGEKFDEDQDELEKIKLIYNKSKENLNEKFLDKSDSIYKDIGYYYYIGDGFNSHLGYINLFPLFFGFIQNNSEELLNLLEKIRNPRLLWSESGIRSLSRSDSFYKKNDNYWTSPVWININYLVLRGLKKYYYNNEKAFEIYNELRDNLIDTVCGIWDETGFFWENFDDIFRKGRSNHPFNGWTSLIALIISEEYV